MIGIIRSVYAALSTYSGCNDCGTFTVVLVPLDSLAYVPVPRYVCMYVCVYIDCDLSWTIDGTNGTCTVGLARVCMCV